MFATSCPSIKSGQSDYYLTWKNCTRQLLAVGTVLRRSFKLGVRGHWWSTVQELEGTYQPYKAKSLFDLQARVKVPVHLAELQLLPAEECQSH